MTILAYLLGLYLWMGVVMLVGASRLPGRFEGSRIAFGVFMVTLWPVAFVTAIRS